jgi:hypothetical protein
MLQLRRRAGVGVEGVVEGVEGVVVGVVVGVVEEIGGGSKWQRAIWGRRALG